VKIEGGYQISKLLREMCIVSRHDLIQDPPFSKLDLISCRNVLIFFGIVRKSVIGLFHFALNPGGFLALGPSETESSKLFSIVQGTHHIYTKNEMVGKRHPFYAGTGGQPRGTNVYKGIPAGELAGGGGLRKELERTLLSRYHGAGVVVDETLEVLEILGQTAPYLSLPPGTGSRPVEELQNIRAVAIRGAEIVRQLMIYAGQETEVLELIDVSATVKDMLELLKISVSKHAAIETALGKDLPAVSANPARLRQIVMNLVTNASEAIGDRDGVIRLTTTVVTAGRDLPVANSERLREGYYLQLEVSDTGCGMTTDMQARIFDPFFTTKPAGHGLGLAVVQGIVRSIDGTIRLMSAPGKGTTVQILLPCTEHAVQETRSAASRVEEEKLQPREVTILLVEDEDLLRLAASRMLRKKGFSVIEASDGSAALDLIRTHQDHIDVVLLDITLSGASSREVFNETKRLRPDVRVIVTSAYNEEAAVASLAARVEHFIRKPYSLDDVLNTIREILC
jgi:CheY-like chemotaxis protein